MEFEEFIEAYGSNWTEDEKKWAELIWYQELLLGFYEAKFAAGVISIYIEKIVSNDFFQKYLKARALMEAGSIADQAKARAEGRFFE